MGKWTAPPSGKLKINSDGASLQPTYDKNLSAAAEDAFKHVKDALDFLSDPVRKEDYDKSFMSKNKAFAAVKMPETTAAARARKAAMEAFAAKVAAERKAAARAAALEAELAAAKRKLAAETAAASRKAAEDAAPAAAKEAAAAAAKEAAAAAARSAFNAQKLLLQ
ncbi:hypothetical protein ACLB2K_032172 [Fragaria x ananassa]